MIHGNSGVTPTSSPQLAGRKKPWEKGSAPRPLVPLLYQSNSHQAYWQQLPSEQSAAELVTCVTGGCRYPSVQKKSLPC